MKIIGIDPGSARVGYGVVETAGKLTVLTCGTIEPEGVGGHERLHSLKRNLETLLRAWRPEKAGVERLFFGRNRKTALGVAESRGVILETLAAHKIPVLEYAPSEIKRAVAGDGNATKEGVGRMVRLTLGLRKIPGRDDAVDGLAIAITVALMTRNTTSTGFKPESA